MTPVPLQGLLLDLGYRSKTSLSPPPRHTVQENQVPDRELHLLASPVLHTQYRGPSGFRCGSWLMSLVWALIADYHLRCRGRGECFFFFLFAESSVLKERIALLVRWIFLDFEIFFSNCRLHTREVLMLEMRNEHAYWCFEGNVGQRLIY